MKIRTQWEPSVASPYGYVYVTHNIAEDVYYCGKHKSSAFDETYFGSGTLLKKAMSKQPLKDFVCVPIDWAESAEELHEKEVSWIKYFNAVSDPQWYNLIEDSNKYQEYLDNVSVSGVMNTRKSDSFFKMYNDGALTLAKLGLRRTAYRLALYMWAKMAYQNLFTYDRQRISTTLKLNPSVISLALRELLQVGFLKQIPDAICCE